MSRVLFVALDEGQVVAKCLNAKVGVSAIEHLPGGGVRLVCRSSDGTARMNSYPEASPYGSRCRAWPPPAGDAPLVSRHALWSAILAIVFAGTAQGEDARPPSPVTPLLFFEGTTESIGTMSVAMHRSTSTHSRGVGTIARDGSLSLVQIVQDEGRAPYARRWSVRQVGPGQFTGSMSQATGPVTIQQVGSRFRFRIHDQGCVVCRRMANAARGRPLGDQRGDRQQVRYSCGHIPRPGAQAAVVNIDDHAKPR